MNDPIKKFKKDIKSLALSESEQRSMEKNVFSYIDAKPLTSFAALRSPLSGWFFSHRAFVAYGMVFVLTFVTMASAAEGSLPGDSLYFFKINVNEPLIRTVAVGDELKAKAHIALAERRLLEMEKLLVQGGAEDGVLADLLEEMNENAESVHDYTDKIRQDEVFSAAEVQAELNAIVDVHAKVIKKISATVPHEERSVSEIIIDLEEHGDRTEKAGDELKTALVDIEGEDASVALAETGFEESIDDIEDLKKRVASDADGETAYASSSESEAIRRAEEVIVEGKASIGIGDAENAIESLNEANDIIRETEILIETQDDLEIDIDAPLVFGTSSDMSDLDTE